ncbi:MAG TPA: GDSL-type esterase/lipase family protein [Thermoanaerobaculia bacterium]|nr:GDSL-type esterase/lipase family protein [Thermoanaerobaculia bacterium]
MRGATATVISVLLLFLCGIAAAQTNVAAPKLDGEGKIDCEFLRAHQAFLERGKDPAVRLLFIGDSITKGWDWGDQKPLWDRYFAQYGAANFGIGGDRTEHVLWRIENGELDRVKPEVVVLLIGTNNIGSTAGEIVRGVTAVVESIRARMPDSRLVLMGIFPRGAAADDPSRAKVREVNMGLAKLAGGNVVFLDIGSQFLAPDGTLPKDIMPDALHLSFKGYEIWAEALSPLLEQLMNAAPR